MPANSRKHPTPRCIQKQAQGSVLRNRVSRRAKGKLDREYGSLLRLLPRELQIRIIVLQGRRRSMQIDGFQDRKQNMNAGRARPW